MKDDKHSATCHLTSTGPTDKTIIQKIMLRFRPIAPKPSIRASGTVDPSIDKINGRKKRGRPRRKYAKSKIGDRLDPTAKMTLQLLPEVPHQTIGSEGGSDQSHNRPSTMRFVGSETDHSDNLDPTVSDWFLKVETVTDMYTYLGLLGNTDDERIKNLEVDTCPGFVSDGRNVVRWINPTFKKMARVQDWCKVSLAVRCELPVEYPAFACRVRVESAMWRKEKGSSCQVVPCDVWRMGFGGLAWRLDLNAALTLGGHFMEFQY